MKCSIESCDKEVFEKGWCSAHYTRWRRHGDPLGGGISRGEPLRFFNDVILLYEGDECLTWPFGGKSSDGYGRVRKDGKDYVVSNLVCEIVHGPRPTPRHQAAHSCGKGHLGCCNKRHIDWKTPPENEADKIEHGTMLYGEQKPQHKLTEDQVREIWGLRGIETQAALGKRFGVTREAVREIHKGRNWRHLLAEGVGL